MPRMPKSRRNCDKVEGGFPDDPAVPATQFAAGENNAEVLFHHQRVGDVKVIGHNPQIVVIEQGVRHRFRRGADINKQRRPVRDLAGHPPGDTLFLRRLGRFAIVPEVFTELEGSAAPP